MAPSPVDFFVQHQVLTLFVQLLQVGPLQIVLRVLQARLHPAVLLDQQLQTLHDLVVPAVDRLALARLQTPYKRC